MKTNINNLTGWICPPSKSLQFKMENYALDLLEFAEGEITSTKVQQFFRLRHHTLNLLDQTRVATLARKMQGV